MLARQVLYHLVNTANPIMKVFKAKRMLQKLGMVVHTYNHSSLGSGDKRIMG
jgi:hypothetical protein